MMKYRNNVTGAVIETDCKIVGEHWEEVILPSGVRSSTEATEGQVTDSGLRNNGRRRKPLESDVKR